MHGRYNGPLAGSIGDRPPVTLRRRSALLVLALAPQIFELLWSFGDDLWWQAAVIRCRCWPATGSRWCPARPACCSDRSARRQDAVRIRCAARADLFLSAACRRDSDAARQTEAPQDYFGGVVLMAVALFALWASSDLQGMRGFSFGAGTAPRMFGVLLLVLGVAIALIGLVDRRTGIRALRLARPAVRLAVDPFFAVAIRPLGLVVSAFASFLIVGAWNARDPLDRDDHRRHLR